MNYTAQDIETLSFRDAIRERVAMYMGSADNQGVLQCVREIITNSIDEATMGFGDLIVVELDKDNKVTVADYARGVPFGEREDGTEAMEAIYTMAHTGGKFNEKIYQNVAGMNGIGSKGVALSSSYFKAVSYRDDKKATLILKEGIKQSFEIVDDTKHKPGTVVSFIPSQEVYNLEPIHIDFEELKEMCKNWAYLTKGVKFRLINHLTKEKVEYFSKNGILDFLKDSIKKPIHRTPLYISVKEDGIECEVAMQWTADRKEHWYVFTNGLANAEGGTSLTGVKTALTNFFKKKFKGEFSPEVARSGLFYVVNCKVPNPSFANQTKTKVNNPELRGLAQRATGQMLEEFSRRYVNEFDSVLELLTKELKAERAAEKARKQVLEASKEIEKSQKINDMDIKKLSEAEVLGENSILLCVEGKSAASNIRKARDPKKYGLLQLRGKCINALSNPIEDVLANEEVKLLLKATGINIRNYKQSKLRYGKVGICVDADDDGRHIACLIIALFYVLAPEFLKENRLVWLHAPLYKVTSKGKRYYYYTEEELAKGVKGEQIHFKGLGEMDDLTDNKVMFDPETQRLETLTWDDSLNDIIVNLMGKDSQPKKDFVFSRIDFEKYGEI